MLRVNSNARPIEQVKIRIQLNYSMHSALNKAIKVSMSTLKKEPRLYLKPVYTVKEDGSEELEEIADSKPYIKFKKDKAWFTFQKSRGGQVKVSIESLKEK